MRFATRIAMARRRLRPFPFLFSVLVLMSCTACMASGPEVELKGKRFGVELATKPEDQQLGLMFRDHLDDDRGMLFIFPREGMRSFWMKNTRIPLDIFYFDDELRLVNVVENARPCRVERCPAYPSKGPARYVLELNAGKAAELGVKPGDELLLFID